MKVIIVITLLFFIFGCSTNVKNDCFKDKDFSYCITTSTNSASTEIVYFFHGKGGSETEFYTDFKQLINAWDSKSMPTVVSISFGQIWLIDSNKYDKIFNKAIPEIENKIGKAITKRMILGESMGGFNSASIIAKNPKFFQKAMLNCPALITFSPFNVLEIPAYLVRTKAEYKNVLEFLALLAFNYSILDKYNNVSPFKLLTSEAPEMYVSCGNKDEYGFFEGDKAFVDLAKSKGIKAEYEELKGGHCVWNYKRIAEFLQ